MERPLRSADSLLRPAVNETIRALDLDEKDAAAIRLAEQFADIIDAAPTPARQEWTMRWIAPLLLQTLESLGATPASRRLMKETMKANGEGQLAKLRAARRA